MRKRAKGPLKSRIEATISIAKNGCWNWLGYRDRDGYGSVTFDGITRIAHRASYEAHVGPIPEGLVIDHLCRNRACVNPRHLEPVTQAENLRRGQTTRPRPLCSRGHLLAEHGITRKNGHRYCRLCANASDRQRRLEGRKA